MFIEQNLQEPVLDGEPFNDNDQSLEQSFSIDQHFAIKEREGPLILQNSYLNQLIEETTLSPEKENARRLLDNKLKYKKLKQKLNLLTEQIQDQGLLKDQRDITSPNKSRLMKLALELEKSIKTQAVDYTLVQSLLRQIQKIVEHKREHDLLILRGARFMTTLHSLIKRFPALHRTEAAQSMQSMQYTLRLLRIMLSLSSSRQLLLVSNQLVGITGLLSCALMREQRKLAISCLSLLTLVLYGPNKVQLHQIINANLQYMLCSSLLKRLKCYLETCLAEDDPSHAEFLLLGYRFYSVVLNRCCQKQLERPIYGTPVMDNLSRAINGYFESLIQHLSFSVTELVFEKQFEGEEKYSYIDSQIPNFKINVLLYIFKSLNVIFHVNVSFAQKIIDCNVFFLKALLFVFNFAKENFKQHQQTKLLCNEIITFIGNVSFQNEQLQNVMRESGLLASFSNHPLQYMMDPLKHIFLPAYCSLVYLNPKNIQEAFMQNSVLTLLQYIQKQISFRNDKKWEDEPCFEVGYGTNINNQCKTLSRKTSVSSMNSNYSKASMAESYTTQASSTGGTVHKQVRLQYKFRPQCWEDLARQLIKIDD